MSNKFAVPGALAAALMTGRAEMIDTFRQEIVDNLTPDGANALLDLAKELLNRNDILEREVEQTRIMLRKLQQNARGLSTLATRIEVRIAAAEKGEDPDAADAAYFTERAYE